MARIAGINIPQNKLVHVGLTYIYGIGDKFSSQICSSLKIPKEMFTVMFALGRVPGWIAHWREMRMNNDPIGRPRQVYTGENLRPFVPLKKR